VILETRFPGFFFFFFFLPYIAVEHSGLNRVDVTTRQYALDVTRIPLSAKPPDNVPSRERYDSIETLHVLGVSSGC